MNRSAALATILLTTLAYPALAKGKGSVRCCPPASQPGENGAAAGRCLERLVRNGETTDAACAALVGTGLFATQDSRQESCPRGGNFFGLKADQWVAQGWWQDGPPGFPAERQSLRIERMALGSKGCDTPEWKWARENCKDGFEPVHLYLALSPDASVTFAKKASEVDPWSSDASLRHNVVMANPEDFAAVQAKVNELVSQCKIVRYALLSSHGTPGLIYAGYEGKKGHRTVPGFVRDVISPCALAPGAKLQFDGCLFACGEVAEPMRQGLENVFTSKDYSTPASQRTLEGVQILMATGLMRDRIYDKSRWYFFGPETRHTEVLPENGAGIIYSVRSGKVEADEPTQSVAACPDRYKVAPKALERVSRAE